MIEFRNLPVMVSQKTVGKAYSKPGGLEIDLSTDVLEQIKSLVAVGLIYGIRIEIIPNEALPLRDGAVVPLTPEEIDNRTLFHKGTDETMPHHKVVRREFNTIMTILNDVLPDGRAKSLCMTQLEDAEMWANKAVAETAPIVRE